ncbi:tRNA (N6-isopentenyl adenosine(37)-C2)-methylthiotransferase MiaB [Candidatus Fermentibacteria bacterium]|nr:MAG: tRNA (N6-isopentenyl adenosine(37)-C2)-methylthiotransferase MiaB [Candidatus Fermentibacteria bacterium]
MKCLIEVYGCQMNVHDGEILAGILIQSGHELTDEISEAEAVLVVTCAVREHAETRALGRLTHLAGLCSSRRPVMVLCGCVAQEHGSSLLKKMKVLDFVVGPDEYHRLPELLSKGGRKALTTQGEENYEGFTPVRTEFPRAFVNIIRGCDNYCTYCIVPYVRGTERSRSPELITAEVAQLVEEGYGEITLLGQNVNSYTFEKTRFPQLLAQVSDIAGDRCRIRFVTSHPRDLSEELAMVMASRKNICKSFHLPVQSGSDRVLKAMNRGYTRKGYLEKVAMLRDLMPDIVLSTDMIAGFPGETPEDFQKSVSLLDEVRYDYAFLFRYSERKGTEAAEMSPSVPVEERLRRLYVLQDLQGRVTMEKSKALVGREMPVLVTGTARRPGQLASRTGGNRMVILENCEYEPGETVQVRITAADGYTHFGEPV